MEETMENEKYKYCNRCHRKLIDAKSRELGYGKICYKKHTNKQSIYLFDVEVTNETSGKTGI